MKNPFAKQPKKPTPQELKMKASQSLSSINRVKARIKSVLDRQQKNMEAAERDFLNSYNNKNDVAASKSASMRYALAKTEHARYSKLFIGLEALSLKIESLNTQIDIAGAVADVPAIIDQIGLDQNLFDFSNLSVSIDKLTAMLDTTSMGLDGIIDGTVTGVEAEDAYNELAAKADALSQLDAVNGASVGDIKTGVSNGQKYV